MDNYNLGNLFTAQTKANAEAMKIMSLGLESITKSFQSMNIQTSQAMAEISRATSLRLEGLVSSSLQAQMLPLRQINDRLSAIVNQHLDIAAIWHLDPSDDAAEDSIGAAEAAIETAIQYIPKEHQAGIAQELHQKKKISLENVLTLIGILLTIFFWIHDTMSDKQQQEYERQRDLTAQQQSEAIQQQNEAIYVVLDGLQDSIILLNERLQEMESTNSAEIDAAESDAQTEDSNTDDE